MESLREFVLGQVKALKPSLLSKKPHFNFISAHYFWIIGMTLLGSVIVFGAGKGNIAYIDALFFAGGANTQAGLNTVDLNLLNTFQQLTLYLFAMLSSPITINSFVVLLRLFWFEKRFQNIVKEARLRRSTMTKSKSKAKPQFSDVESGVNGRNITVMHNGNKSRITNDGMLLDNNADLEKVQLDHAMNEGNGAGPDAAHELNHNADPGAENEPAEESPPEIRRPEVKFSGTVKRSDGLQDDTIKLPPMRSDEEHIAILERQRHGDDEVLRIPGPRDAERGMRPERVVGDDDDDEEPEPEVGSRLRRLSTASSNGPNGPRRQTITIAEPERIEKQESDGDFVDDAKAVAKALSFLKLRRPRLARKGDKRFHREEDKIHATPSRSRRLPTLETLRTALSRDKEEMAPYLSWEPTLGRNSAFPDLSEEQREELGGIEYRSLKTLALILTCYFWGFTIFAFACLIPWILKSNTYGQIVDNVSQNRVWWGFFTANSAFMDLGFTLTPDSMNSFNTAIFPLLLMSFLIVIGNTGFPVMLRFLIWLVSLAVPRGTGLWEELRFLLDHPRRCFTLLFPSGATWWLFWLLVILNGLDLMFFIILDLGSGPVINMSTGIKIIDGIFQAASTRTAGFSCVNLANLHPGVQVSYMIMMYISVFPIAISVRRTNVYEEKSLGIYSQHDLEEQSLSDLSYVGAHLRRQLSFDLWYIFIGFFILSISEGSRLMSNDFSMFAVLFEVVSAYGTVGMSLGYPTVNASLSSQFTVVGKLVILAMMIRGRHRGLPYGLDRAILLPSESLITKEAADAEARMARRGSQGTLRPDGGGGSVRPHTRGRSIDRVNSNLLTSLLQPGPSKFHEHPMSNLPRRSTDPGSEDDTPYASRLFPRRSATSGPSG